MESLFYLVRSLPRSLQIASRFEKRFRLPKSAITDWWADGLMLMKLARLWLALRRKSVCAYLIACSVAVIALMPFDLSLLHLIRQENVVTGWSHVNQVAQALSYWGDFMGFNMLVFVGLGMTARIRRSLLFRRLVIAAVIGTVTCGAVANVTRLLSGRSRPSSKATPGFYGLSFSSSLQSFPSAHTATAFGVSVPLAVALPPVGVPMLLISAGVSWSRMQNNRHHPSDVLASVLLSLFVGVPLGVVVRRMRRSELQRRRKSRTDSVQLDLAPLKPSTK